MSEPASIAAYRFRKCGHVGPLMDTDAEPCPYCEHMEIFLDELVALAMQRAAVRAHGYDHRRDDAGAHDG